MLGVPAGMEEPKRAADGAEECFAEYLARREAGDALDFEAWVGRHPEHERDLRRLHTGWSGFEVDLREVARDVFQRVARSVVPSTGPEPVEVREGGLVGDYVLVRLLGRGGMGEVWEARDRSLHRRVALKVLPASIASSERFLRRFEREAEAGARLNHPNIVAVHAYGHAGGRPFLAEELVEGGRTLAQALREMDPGQLLPDYYRRAANLVLSVAHALHSAHAAGVIHRDVKPQNILLTPEDVPKVSDFGVARVVDVEPISREGETLGTYCYMSPEQVARRRRPLDRRTDVFSLGATLYEVLTLERAFPGSNTPAVAQSILYHDPPSPDRVRAGVPRELAAICTKALEKEPEERYATMADLAEDLRRFLVNEPVRAAPPGPWLRLRKWVRRHPAASLVSAVILAALAGIATLSWVHGVHSRDLARENAYLLAAIDISADAVDRARATVEAAHAVYGARPMGHLILARGSYRWGRVDEAQEELERAVALGFEPDSQQLDTPLERCTYGLYVLTTSDGDRERFAEAERILAPLIDDPRQLERDPQLLAGAFGLYQARKELGDVEGARAALRTYQRGLPSGNPYARMVHAYLLELDGDLSKAIAELEGLCEELDDAGERELRIHRRLGRYLLELKRYQPAEVHLRRAIAESPDDSWSLGNLAMLHYERARRATDPAAFEAELRACDDACRRAMAISPRAPSHHLRAAGAILRLERAISDGSDPQPAAFEEAIARARELGEALDEPDMAHAAQAQILYLSAEAAHFLRQDPVAAQAAYRRCLEFAPDHVEARMALARMLWGTGHDEELLAHLDAASAAFERWRQARAARTEPLEPGIRFAWSSELWQACKVWTFGVATRLGLAERARDALREVEDDLIAGSTWPPTEVLNLAEFLATSPLESARDCGLARRLIETYGLRRQFADDPNAQAVLDAIGAACDD